MTKLKLATIAGIAALGVSAAGAAAAQGAGVTSMGYVDSLQWKINHAADQGAINPGQRDRLLDLQHRTHDLAWRCNQGSGWACRRTEDNVQMINSQISDGYNYHRGWRRHW